MIVCHIFASHVIFLIFWLSFTMDNFTMKRVFSKYHGMCYQIRPWPLRSAIVQVCISNSVYICFKPYFIYFWRHLKDRPKCIDVRYLPWPSIPQSTTATNTFGFIVVFRNFAKPDFFGLVKYSWRRILSYLSQS